VNVPQPVGEIPVPGQYDVDVDKTSIAFTTFSIFGLIRVTGTLTAASGRIVVAPAPLESTVEIVVATAGITTGNRRRDAHVRSATFLDAARYPDMIYRSHRVEEVDGGWTMPGILTVHGTAGRLDLRVSPGGVPGQTLVARAAGRVDRYAHGVGARKGLVARYLDVEITVHASRSAGAPKVRVDKVRVDRRPGVEAPDTIP
jgi:polyisoprenoid-binding protein YceI